MENIRPRYQYELGKVKYGEFESDASFLFATLRAGESTTPPTMTHPTADQTPWRRY